MSITENFRRQHGEMLALANQLKGMLNVQKLTGDAAECSKTLSQLMGLLKIHLATEDSVLYPKLQKSPDANVRDVCRRYVTEMGGLKEVVGTYSLKWCSPTVIRGDASGFVKETNEIIEALGKRIQREESELYVLADKSA